MVELLCECGHPDAAPESAAGGIWACPACGRQIQLACAENLPEGAGEGDFDASLTIVDGPDRVSQKILLGGVASIEIGKADTKHIHLPGQRISRNHCKLNRLDFGPSRWEVEDQNATNGTFINGQKIAKQELKPGDTLHAGEYELLFDLSAPMQPTAVAGEEIATALPEAQPSAPPPPPVPTAKKASSGGAKSKTGRAAPQTLAYESDHSSEGPRPLGECDVTWVMKLRNASTLMCWSAIIFLVGRRFRLHWIPHFTEVQTIITSFMGLAADWLLTSPEPGVRQGFINIRTLLRAASVPAYAGLILFALGLMLGSIPIGAVGLVLCLAMIPEKAFFLFYLRRLALRIPNEGLAFACMLVMVAFPTCIGIVLFCIIRAAGGSGAEGNAVLGFLAFIGLIVTGFGYAGLLIWFNKSFS